MVYVDVLTRVQPGSKTDLKFFMGGAMGHRKLKQSFCMHDGAQRCILSQNITPNSLSDSVSINGAEVRGLDKTCICLLDNNMFGMKHFDFMNREILTQEQRQR